VSTSENAQVGENQTHPKKL